MCVLNPMQVPLRKCVLQQVSDMSLGVHKSTLKVRPAYREGRLPVNDDRRNLRDLRAGVVELRRREPDLSSYEPDLSSYVALCQGVGAQGPHCGPENKAIIL